MVHEHNCSKTDRNFPDQELNPCLPQPLSHQGSPKNSFKGPGSMLRNAMLMPIFLQKSFYHPVFQFEFREAKSASQSHTDSGGGGLVAKSCLTLTTPQALAHQAPLLMGFSRQGCWTGLPFIPPGDLPNPGIKARSPALQADSLLTAMGKPYRLWCTSLCLWHSCSCLLCYPSVGFLLPKRSNTVPQAGGTAYYPPPTCLESISVAYSLQGKLTRTLTRDLLSFG